MARGGVTGYLSESWSGMQTPWPKMINQHQERHRPLTLVRRETAVRQKQEETRLAYRQRQLDS